MDIYDILRPPLKKKSFLSSGWPKSWPIGPPLKMNSLFIFVRNKSNLGGGGGICKNHGKNGKKSSQSARKFPPGRWTRNKLFFKDSLTTEELIILDVWPLS